MYLFKTFFNKINNLTDKHAPLHKLTRKQVRTLTKPWITKAIQIEIHKRQKLHKLFINTKYPTLTKLYELEFKKYRNMIVSLTRKSKKKIISPIISITIFITLKKYGKALIQSFLTTNPKIVVCPHFMLIIIVIFPQIQLLFPINLMIIFPMLQKLQEPKFLILRNTSLSF